MAAAIWITAYVVSIGAISVAAAASRHPPEIVAFDKPLIRAAATMLGWAGIIMALVFAIMLDGLLWPLITALVLGMAGWRLGRSRFAAGAAGAAIYLAAAGLVCNAALFQLAFKDVVVP